MIKSKDNETIKDIVKLVKSAKYRRETETFIAEGVRICRDGVRSGFVPQIFLYTSTARLKYSEDFEVISLVSSKNIEISESISEKISDTKSPQGFFCVFNMLDKQKNPFTIDNCGNYIALENVQDPSNLGTILRTAEAFGFDGVIMSNDCCDLYSPKVVRGSMGAVFRLPSHITDNMADYARDLVSRGINVYGSTPRNAEDITSLQINGGVMLIGNEGNGLSNEVLDACSKRVKIPMGGRAESLNAAAAAAVLMWEMVR